MLSDCGSVVEVSVRMSNQYLFCRYYLASKFWDVNKPT